MPLPDPITALTDRRIMNRLIDKTITRHTALYNLLFPPQVRETLDEEYVQIDVEEGKLGMAPFVKVGTKAIMVDTLNGTSYTIKTPFINIKRPLTYSTRLASRLVGGGVFTSNGQGTIAQAILDAQRKDVKIMNTLCDNREEWLAAMILRGTVDYSQEGGDSFTISTGKPAANTYTVSNLWNGGSANIEEDIFTVKKLVSEARGPMPNIAVCGANAATALRQLISTGALKSIDTTNNAVFGKGDLLSNIQDNGMVYLGTFGLIDFFQYLGTYAPDGGGSDEYLIRDDYVEYFSTSPQALDKRVMFYGLIPDIKAIMDGNAKTERYIVSKEPDVDQGTIEGILKTRPMPWIYRPDWYVSTKVV